MTFTIDLEGLRGLDAHREALNEINTRHAALEKEADGRPFTEEQREEFDGLVALRGNVQAAIDELEIRDQYIQEALTSGERATESASALPVPNINKVPDDIFDISAYRQRAKSVEELPSAFRDGAMRVIEQASFPTSADESAAQAQVARIVDKHQDDDYGAVSRRVIHTQSEAYRKAWAQYVSGGLPAVSGGRMMAALQTYSDSDGGYAIPVSIDPTFVLTTDGAVNPLREGMARIETITTKTWSPITTAGVVASYAAETASATDDAPDDVASPGVSPLRAHVLVGFTAEYTEDYGPAAIQAEVGNLIRDAKNVLEASKFIKGSGSGEPTGIITALLAGAAPSVIESATDATFALADVDALEGDLGDRFIGNAQWLAARKIYQLARAFGTAGQPANSIYDAMARTLRGYPARISNNMDKTTTAASEPLLFGDFSKFVIVDRLGLSTEYIPQIFDGDGKPLGRRGVYARWRNNTGMMVVNAFRLLQIGTP